jgi:hypothetical protein
MFWVQKQWPLEISSSLTDGSYMIQNKEVTFMAKLEQEKENFLKSIQLYTEHFEKIKNFNNVDKAYEYSADAFSLQESLTNAQDKVRQFNDREALFNQMKSEYPELDELIANFKPFYDLTSISYEALSSFKDWKVQSLMKAPAAEISSQVNTWQQ